MEFPKNFFHLRHPISKPLENTLDEPEIAHRIVTAMGEVPKSFPVLEQVAKLDRKFPNLRILPLALGVTMFFKPKWKKYQLLILKETLGKALPYSQAKAAAFIWFACHLFVKKYEKQVRRLGYKEKGYALAEALFLKILNSKSGTFISEHTFEESWELVRHKDKKVHLEIPEMLKWLNELPQTSAKVKLREDKYPFNLIAGERRSYNANAILRDPEWRKKDVEGVLKMNPADAKENRIVNGDWLSAFPKQDR